MKGIIYMINVLINGCNGKMGKEVEKQIKKYDNMHLSCGFDIYDDGFNHFPVYQKFYLRQQCFFLLRQQFEFLLF